MEELEKQEEEKYLKKVLKQIKHLKKEKDEEYYSIVRRKNEFSSHFSDDFYTMDDEEAISEGERLAEFDSAKELISKSLIRLNRQEYSPYFGRVDFKTKGERKINSYYIGVNNLVKDGDSIPYICDWRAPVSSLFYDYEMGNAEYNAPDGVVKGDISLKRQYDIKDGKLDKYFDSSLTIGDDILKDVLSHNASSKMKTIVSTIQREQNAIIRNYSYKNMLVQGVAGSGKTSIALHRIAYLLYQNKNTLKAEDVLILSPNTLFSEYISDVLPELGEENMSQLSFYKLAKQELKHIGISFETRENNINELTLNEKRLNEVAYKNTYDFYESLKNFCETYFNLSFNPTDLKFDELVIKKEELNKLYNETYKTKTPAVRVEWIVDYIVDKLNVNTAVAEVSERVKRLIYPFFDESNILKIYSGFLISIGMEFSLNKNGEIRYEDLGALLYIENYFFGLPKHSEVKYLIIDEMQDYSFVHYSVFNSIFDCSKTILGDINQCIEKVMTKEDLSLLKEMLNAEYIEMNKSYRSTYEITEFANKIKGITCEKLARHGDEPKGINVKNKNLENVIKEIIEENKDRNSFAILTKNEEEARQIYINLKNIENLSLNISSEEIIDKICIMPSYMSKGLEFDVVIIPNFNKKNYSSFLNKSLLYVSSTRALHKLYLLKNQ